LQDGTAIVHPTLNYLHFVNAEKLGMTVGKLLTGHDMPMAQMEHYLWMRKAAVDARLDAQRPKPKR
jgi:hypothetical protein